ncbi:MAG: SIMPL domain-containing protein, partial [Pseudohongiellaceae bacterium]
DIDNPLWQGRQGVQLSSQDSASLLALVGELQELGLTMSGLHYSLSPRRQEEVADSLMETALDKLRNRAAATADAMGKRDVEIVEITMNSSGGGGYYRSMSTAMAMESSMDVATPVAEPGMTTVSFNVSARAILLP